MQFCNEQIRTQPLFSPPCASATYGSARMCRQKNYDVTIMLGWAMGCWMYTSTDFNELTFHDYLSTWINIWWLLTWLLDICLIPGHSSCLSLTSFNTNKTFMSYHKVVAHWEMVTIWQTTTPTTFFCWHENFHWVHNFWISGPKRFQWTHWCWDKMAATLQTTFLFYFIFNEKYCILNQISPWLFLRI